MANSPFAFFAVDQHVHAQVTGIDVSVYLPDRLSDSFFQLLEFVSEVFNKEAFLDMSVRPTTFPVSKLLSFLAPNYGKDPSIAYVPVSVLNKITYSRNPWYLFQCTFLC